MLKLLVIALLTVSTRAVPARLVDAQADETSSWSKFVNWLKDSLAAGVETNGEFSQDVRSQTYPVSANLTSWLGFKEIVRLFFEYKHEDIGGDTVGGRVAVKLPGGDGGNTGAVVVGVHSNLQNSNSFLDWHVGAQHEPV